MNFKKPKIVILEGHRLVGKSTIARYLRNRVNYATLINATGFPERGDEGFNKVAKYYANWTMFLRNFDHPDSYEILFIFDRYMFSEVVYSRLYKDYNFDETFDILLRNLLSSVDIELYFFELDDDEELTRRAKRDKVEWAGVADDVNEVKKQREGYRKLLQELRDRNYNGLSTHLVNVSHNSSSEVADALIKSGKF